MTGGDRFALPIARLGPQVFRAPSPGTGRNRNAKRLLHDRLDRAAPIGFALRISYLNGLIREAISKPIIRQLDDMSGKGGIVFGSLSGKRTGMSRGPAGPWENILGPSRVICRSADCGRR